MAAPMVDRIGDRSRPFAERLRSGEYRRFIRFCVVGGTGVVVNQAFLLVGLWVFGGLVSETLRDQLAILLGIVVSIFTNFILNDIWTWGDRPKLGVGHWFKRLAQYYLVASVAAFVQWAVTSSLHEWVFNWHLVLTNFFGIAAGILVNYHFNNRWTFRKPDADTPAESAAAGEPRPIP